MSREIDHSTREKHAETTDNLLRMIADFETTLNAGEKIGTVQTRNALSTLEAARSDLSRCKHPTIHWRTDLIPAPELEDHRKLIDWIGLLHIDLTLMQEKMQIEMQPMTLQRMSEGLRLVNDLSRCRERLKFS